MPHSVLNPWDTHTSRYIITHVFCPLQLPGRDDHSIDNDRALTKAIAAAARLYSDYVDQSNISQWHSISRMLDNLQGTYRSDSLHEFQTVYQFSSMSVGDVLALHIRAQNVGVLFRKQNDVTIFESFELSPMARDVMTNEGKLVCSYPGSAIEIPNLVFENKDFLSELVNFLIHMHRDVLEVALQSSTPKDTVHPRHITELLTGILRSVGRPADVTRTSKRVGDQVVWNDDPQLPWRRSALWLLIKVALQTTLGRNAYKAFILFFMCCLAEGKLSANLPSDIVHFMSAKISRRLQKLGASAPDWLSSAVLQTCTLLRSVIEKRWEQVQATQRKSPPWTPSQFDFSRDIRLSLLGSGGGHSLPEIEPPDIPFDPQHPKRGSLSDFLSSDGRFFEETCTGHYITLYDVEQAIEKGIDTWVDQITNNNEASVQLEILADKYSSTALQTYGNNPEFLSVMYLTTFELWVALDKIAIKEIPMLADYSPEVPTSLLENLLLCKTSSLHRLRRAQQYLSRRHAQSRSQWSVFSSAITADSFAVRFYRSSSHHQRLKAQIEGTARSEVHKKVAELQDKNRTKRPWRTEDTISVHVWPLPADQLQAEVVVFELDCPIAFNMWRSATFHLLVDIWSAPVQQFEGPRVKLDSYQPLETYLVKHPRSRILLGSAMWPRHDHVVPIPAKLKQVCLENNLEFFAFDTRTGKSVSGSLGCSDNSDHCTYKLPSGPYYNLQHCVGLTSHTSNEIIANQADCHEDLSVHEYLAFGHLRSGELLQWLNILRELRGRSLTFCRPEVHMLITQAVSQAGPLGEKGWTWHQEIQEPSFCHALIGELQSLARDVEANWMEATTMDTISFLLRRVLASSIDEATSKEVLDLLRTVRIKVFSWVQELLFRVANTPGDERLRGVLRDTAVICRSTFDVDPALVSQVLHSAEDVGILLSSAIIIHDHTPSDVSHLPMYSQLLLDRDRRLSLALESVVSMVIQVDPSDEGINLAVGRIWPEHHPGSTWTPLDPPNSRWFWCTTAPHANRSPQVVHLNILDGSLLVNRGPFRAPLPNKLVGHPLYKLIFGEKSIAATQDDLGSMNYSSIDLVCDHQVYFSLGPNGSTLVIRAKRKGDSEIIELIPHERLEGDLPTVLIHGHAHWLNRSTSVMEIRPLHSLWETSSDNWKAEWSGDHYYMRKGNEYLVDVRSPSWDMVSRLLRPLSPPQDLIISVSPISPSHLMPDSPLQLSVVLPRYGLSFYVDEDRNLQSRDFRDMIYDEDQSIGTLFGLVNQLVLRSKNEESPPELVPRCVLVPDGSVSFRMDGHHARVEITTDPSILQRVTYQTYRVNADLGCLTGNGSLTSKLYCAYLHALTSGILPDPLTGRTGVEEALSILRSAGCMSSARCNSRDANLIGSIASMHRLQVWYPRQPMRNIEWQTQELYIASKAIKEHYERVELFHESPSISLFEGFPSRDDGLLRRSARRAAHIFPPDFPGQPSEDASGVDVRYRARDLVTAAPGEHLAYAAATCVYRRTVMRTVAVWELVSSWRNMSGASGDTALSLQYDKSWLAPNLPSIWLKTYNLLRQSDERKWFQMLFSLPAMAYGSSNLGDLVPMFVAFASNQQFRSEDPPHYDSYPIANGCDPSLDTLREFVVDCAYPFERSPERTARYGILSLESRQFQKYGYRRNSDAEATAQTILRAWPSAIPPPSSLDPRLYNVTDLENRVQDHFSRYLANFELREHLARVQSILDDLPSRTSSAFRTPHYPHPICPSIPLHIPWPFTLQQLFSRPAPALPSRDRLHLDWVDDKTSTPDSTLLHRLIATVSAKAASTYQRQYALALRTSAEHFENETSLTSHKVMKLPIVEILLEHHSRCRTSYIEGLERIRHHLGPRNPSERVIEQSGQWPRVTVQVLFRCLASNAPTTLPDDWKMCLTGFALLALELQRARRLLSLHFGGLHQELHREILNEGCDGWDAEANPDWLLIQLQGNFFIRRVQTEVVNEMMSPHSGGNTTMQLNMGEGKSSVIVPIVAAALADGSQLVRVIVPKPLIPQTLHLLTDRLGGLTDRRIYYVPFSRSSAVTVHKAASLHRVMLECMQERGIVVVQPDHVLSLKLVSVEKQPSLSDDYRTARQLLELQRWLHSHSRDILDDSDEILDIRSQLVFSMGRQRHLDGPSERWTTIQQVLGLVSKHASSLAALFPLGVHYEPGPAGSFPYLRIMQAEATDKLISWVVDDIMEGLLPNVSFGQLHLRSDIVDIVRAFITCETVPPTSAQAVKECYGQTQLLHILLLLRGLLASGILSFALTDRRWRVDYGLSPTRTMLAVPYRAKDVPAQKAEFGHPDITIILTYMSYYYGGLSEEQLRQSFELLSKQHDTSSAYDLWVRTCPAVPESVRTLSGVNIQSAEQWNRILFPLFSRNRETINFYLSKVVFLKEAREFPLKLCSSGWDLVEKKERVLTGLSGTNDNRYLLPLSLSQHDLDHERGTNAKVLSYLLQSENNHYKCTADKNRNRQTSREFLQILVAQKPEIRVLLDVGGQIFDLQNHELAKAWLDMAPSASAAVYFNEDDEIMVQTRDGNPQLLRSSPFAQQLDRCIVYLDDAHTRGTDIQFTMGFRAAVTLGSKITKDRLVQGCMRMWMLGHGHSVTFFAPLEVDRRIRSVVGKSPSENVEAIDVLHWTIVETWDNVRRWAPHWVQQGIDHGSRYPAWLSYCSGQLTSKELSDKWLRSGTKGLEDLYEARNAWDLSLLTSADIRQRCNDLGVLSLGAVGMDEEQERELVDEVKCQQVVVTRPSKVQPAKHSIHPGVVDFIKTGVISAESVSSRTNQAFRPAFDSLGATSAATDESSIWSQSVLVTKDFEETVQATGGKVDDYLRPVHWVLSAKRESGDVVVVLSPYEANSLLSDIRSSDKIHLHLYATRVTKSTRASGDLALYNIPSVPDGWFLPSSFADQLGMFAGDLYLKDYDTYLRLCRFLCVYTRELKGKGITVEPDGFIKPENRNDQMAHMFSRSPLVVLRALMELRNNGIDFTSTHSGKLLDGRLLFEEDFDG